MALRWARGHTEDGWEVHLSLPCEKTQCSSDANSTLRLVRFVCDSHALRRNIPFPNDCVLLLQVEGLIKARKHCIKRNDVFYKFGHFERSGFA